MNPRPGAAAGPLGAVVEVVKVNDKPRLRFKAEDVGADSGAGNTLILLRRVAFLDQTGIWLDGRTALLTWARQTRLGQDPAQVRAVAARRALAVAERVRIARRRDRDVVHRRLEVSPEWRLITGIGARANPHEIGIALHGTYGWPVLPGSTLKGAARAWALQNQPQTEEEDIVRVFGPGPQSGSHAVGSVDILDALPSGEPVSVVVDGVTPHSKPYHNEGAAPGEWHNPEPTAFIAVSGGRFAVDLIGPAKDVRLAARWCAGACEDLGIGAKTGAGYGYLTGDDVRDAEGSLG